MPKRTSKAPPPPPPTDNGENSLGLSPAVLAKRVAYVPEVWCPKEDPMSSYYDPMCDPHRPKTIHYSDCARAYRVLKKSITPTRLMKAHGSSFFDMNLYFKLEGTFKTGSFHERGTMYVFHMLTDEQRKGGVVTASLGNFALSLAHEGKRQGVPVTLYFPVRYFHQEIQRCRDFDATVELIGSTLAEATKGAIATVRDTGVGTYINGYDHPHVIAGEGTIAIEILEQLPETEVILVPVGGGGLLAGVTAVVKKIRPDILVYGVEASFCTCFSKALEAGQPYMTSVEPNTVTMPIAGYNAFQTAQPLVDKMIIVEEDWISQAIAHLVENERLVVQRMGAATLAVLFSQPTIAPELRSKNVVCILSGSNIDRIVWPKAIQRAKIIQGRQVNITVSCPYGNLDELSKIFKVLTTLKCNIIYHCTEDSRISMDDINYYSVTMILDTSGWRHADTIKHVMTKLFPGMCTFSEEFYIEQDKCQCYPKLWNI